MSIGWVPLLGVTTTSAVANLWHKIAGVSCSHHDRVEHLFG